MSLYLQKNYKLPDVKSLKGRVFVEFIIESDGGIGEVKMFKDLGFGTGDEVVRVIKNSPKWKPGVQYGKSVRVRYSMPIAIDIH